MLSSRSCSSFKNCFETIGNVYIVILIYFIVHRVQVIIQGLCIPYGLAVQSGHHEKLIGLA